MTDFNPTQRDPNGNGKLVDVDFRNPLQVANVLRQHAATMVTAARQNEIDLALVAESLGVVMMALAANFEAVGRAAQAQQQRVRPVTTMPRIKL